jgi:hypothetical protein
MIIAARLLKRKSDGKQYCHELSKAVYEWEKDFFVTNFD